MRGTLINSISDTGPFRLIVHTSCVNFRESETDSASHVTVVDAPGLSKPYTSLRLIH